MLTIRKKLANLIFQIYEKIFYSFNPGDIDAIGHHVPDAGLSQPRDTDVSVSM